MLIVSSGYKRSILGTKSFADLFDGGEIRLFSGPRPASSDMGEPAAPMARINTVGLASPGLRFVLADTYVVKPLNEVWNLFANKPGQVLWWRLVGPVDDGLDSITAARIDGDVGSTASPSDLTLTKTTFNAGDILQIDSFLYTLPPVGI